MIKNKPEVKKENFSQIMERFGAVISISTREGFTNICFTKDFKENVVMGVKFFDDEGRPITDEFGDEMVPIETVTAAHEFIKTLGDLSLDQMSRDIKKK